jgi:hypothetical protein
MTRPIQKNEEQRYAKRASELLMENWCISQPNNELDWPDLLIKNGDQEFGLEIRKVFKDEKKGGSPSRTGESSRKKQLQCSATEYYKAFSCSVKVQLNGDPGNPCELAKIIGDEAKKLGVWEQVKVHLSNHRWMYVRRLPDEFQQYKKWVLLSDAVGWVGILSSKDLQKAIDMKAKKLPRYRRNVEQVRLLLVCDHFQNSGKTSFTETEKLNKKEFDRIYFMSYPDKIIELHDQKICGNRN